MSYLKTFIVDKWQFIAASILVMFLSYCFHFNVDLTDEGFYLYHYQKGHHAVSFNFYHVLISPLGSLFDHRLLFYRFFSLITISLSSIYLYKSVRKSEGLWIIPLSLGLLYFNLISTFSYNTLVLVGLVLVLGLLFEAQSTFKARIFIAIGCLCFFIYSARFGTGILSLFLCIVSYFLIYSDKKKVLTASVITSLVAVSCLGIYLFFFKENYLKMLEVLPEVYKSSHDGLISHYLKDSYKFILRSFTPPLIILIVSRKITEKYKGMPLLFYTGWMIINYLIVNYDFPKFGYYISGIFLAYSIFEISQSWKSKKPLHEQLFILFIPLSFYFIAPLGTNNNLFKFAPYNLLILYPIITYMFSRGLSYKILSPIVVLVCFIGIFYKQFWQSYRSNPRNQQSFVNSKFSSLSGIEIDKKIEEKLVLAKNSLNISGFDSKRDLILVYPNLPGIPAFLNFSTFGNPWNLNYYRNSYLYNCAFFKVDSSFSKRLYLYLEDDMPDNMAECLKSELVKRKIESKTISRFET